MLKIASIQLAALILTLFSVEVNQAPPMYWGELDVVRQIRIVAGLTFMFCLMVAAFIIFRSVWVRDGYAGADKILVDKEVALFISHVMAFALVEVFFFMVLFYEYVQPPMYVFGICGAGFLSAEVVQIIHTIKDRFKTKENH